MNVYIYIYTHDHLMYSKNRKHTRKLYAEYTCFCIASARFSSDASDCV